MKKTSPCQSSSVQWERTFHQLPEESGEYIVTVDGEVKFATYEQEYETWEIFENGWYEQIYPIAWAHKPDPFQEAKIGEISPFTMAID